MKRSDVVFVREDDPCCTELETEGYEVAGYSWGANLRFDPGTTNLAQRPRNHWCPVLGFVVSQHFLQHDQRRDSSL